MIHEIVSDLREEEKWGNVLCAQAADLIERQHNALRVALRALEDARTAILHKCSPADDIDIAIDAIDAALKEDGE